MKDYITENKMTVENIYQNNKPLVNSMLTGLLYFGFCLSFDFVESTKLSFVIFMQFLPGLTFPLTTCYYQNEKLKSSINRKAMHLVFSLAIYYGSVWIFSGTGRIDYITILAGFVGSFLFQLSTKFWLKKNIALKQIILTAGLSGLAFLPYELLGTTETGKLGVLMGVAIFIWNIANGALLNIKYKRYKIA